MIHAENSVLSKGVHITALLFFVVCISAACGSVPQEYEAFLRLPLRQQHAEMKKMPVSKQIDYYLAGQNYIHPPIKGLADDIAERGKQALPDLMERLKEEEKENRKADLMYVFEVMHRHYYDLKGEKEVIELLKATTTKMKFPEFRERGEETLKVILEDKEADPGEALDRMEKELPNG